MKGQLYNMQSLQNSGLSVVSHKEMVELKKKIVAQMTANSDFEYIDEAKEVMDTVRQYMKVWKEKRRISEQGMIRVRAGVMISCSSLACYLEGGPLLSFPKQNVF